MFANKDQIKGRAKQAKGKIKEVAGHPVSDGKLVTKGRIEKDLGKVQGMVYDASMM